MHLANSCTLLRLLRLLAHQHPSLTLVSCAPSDHPNKQSAWTDQMARLQDGSSGCHHQATNLAQTPKPKLVPSLGQIDSGSIPRSILGLRPVFWVVVGPGHHCSHLLLAYFKAQCEPACILIPCCSSQPLFFLDIYSPPKPCGR